MMKYFKRKTFFFVVYRIKRLTGFKNRVMVSLTIGEDDMTDNDLAEKGLNTEILHDLLSTGAPKKVVAQELGITVSELNRTIKELQTSQGLLLQYRELQHLQLTNLQARVLGAITPEKIDAASITELAQVYRVLKDKELVSQGKANNITGLVGYLEQLEKEDVTKQIASVVEAEYADLTSGIELNELEDATDDLPNL